MARIFKVKIQDTLQNGEFSSEECGQKVSQVLEWYGSTKFDFIETDEFTASAKKSKAQSISFSQQVAKQRAKNISKYAREEYTDAEIELYRKAREILFEPYRQIRDLLSRIDDSEHPDRNEILDKLMEADTMMYNITSIGEAHPDF